MENKSTHRFLTSTLICNSFVGVVYICLGLLCLSMFGLEIQSNVLLNMATRPGIASTFMRLIFSVVLVAHIPYVFFPTKEALLVLIDECLNNSVSEKIERKILDLK